MCGIEGLVYGRALELHSAAYAEQVRQMRSAVEEQIRADARQLPLRGRYSETALEALLLQQEGARRVRVFQQQIAAEADALTAKIWRVAEWRMSNPVLAAGWDDWSRLVREEGWR